MGFGLTVHGGWRLRWPLCGQLTELIRHLGKPMPWCMHKLTATWLHRHAHLTRQC